MKTAANPKEFTVTFKGELAETLRLTAKQMGMRPATWARMCAQTGELLSSPTKEGEGFRSDLARHSRDTGIPKPELEQMCLRAGLGQLQRGELKVKADDGLLPVFLPADDVRLLRELCEAADIEGGADGFIAGIAGDIASDSLNSTAACARGFLELVPGAYVLEDEEGSKVAMQAVVDRWNAKQPEAG